MTLPFERHAAHPQTMRHRVPDLFEWLATLDFSRIHVEYRSLDGRGEFLQPRCYRPLRADYWSIEGERADRLVTFFASLLDSRCPSWREYPGSCGDFRWDLAADEVIHTHYVRGERNERLTQHGL